MAIFANLLFFGGASAFASGGVPVQAGTSTSYTTSGNYDVFPMLPSSTSQTYGGTVTFSTTTPYSGRGYSTIIEVDGSNDGTTWAYDSSYNAGSAGVTLTNTSITMTNTWKQIKVSQYLVQGSGMTTYSTSSITNISAELVVLGADQQTAQTAANNATNAYDAANSANTAAQSAADGTNTIINSYLSASAGVVQDSSGTVLTASRAAQLAAANADTDIKSAQTALTNQLNTVQSSVSNIQTSVQNITNYLPPTLSKVSGYNGATATSSTSFRVTLDYNNATDYQYQVDGGLWSGWNSLSGYNGYVTVNGLSTAGMHTITLQVRNGSGGPTAQGSITVFKL